MAKPTPTTVSELTDAQIQRTRRETAQRDKTAPRARQACYIATEDKIAITLRDDMEIRIPVRRIQGLQQATPDQLANITLTASGNALHWEDLDVQMSVEGLMAGILGTQAWMKRLESAPSVERAAAELGRRGGRVRSEAKAAAVRENGKKGGRPRKRVTA